MNASLVCWDNIPYGGNGIKVEKTFLMVDMGIQVKTWISANAMQSLIINIYFAQ